MSAPSGRINCYEILGIAHDADLKEINSAYKRLALQYHPDKTGGDDESMDEFRKIHQAVEILRDPSRRVRHDDEFNKRSHAPFVHHPQPTRDPFAFGGWARDQHHPSATSELADPLYRGWRPQPYNPWFDLRTASDRYMFSYRNSVHMSPQEEASVEERARSDHMRREYDKWRQSLFEDERVRQARRREAMRANVMRDEEELRRGEMDDGCSDGGASEGCRPLGATPAGLFSQEVGDGSSDWDEKRSVGEARFGEIPGSFPGQLKGGEQVQHPFAGVHTGKEAGLEDGIQERAQVDHQSVASTGVSYAEYETARESSSDDEPVFYDCRDFEDQSHQTNDELTIDEGVHVEHQVAGEELASRAATDSDSDSSTTSSEAATPSEFASTERRTNFLNEPLSYRDTIDPLNTETESPLAPFIPYFNAKLNDPSGRYTPADLSVEIRGLILETYCGWLEDLRLRVPGARPLETGLDPQRCSHLGFWDKDFRPIECEACYRWMPIYTLTCPGCGIKACVSCKFEYAQL